ncbi:hypothetical protein B0H14DRAFT_2502870 [Mycena olivaceomarginata]|nr:hypothetical protein B0H14DRAFT_2475374 [Mycena olivaceomarginata]KAJ7871879.1 hypothetical protein B0H14DRAFT_2502870 [Mycena olivaceomarginata]
MANSWMRYYSSRVRDLCLAVCVGFQHRTEAHKSWLAQLNHIFAQLETTSHSEDYICATVEFTLRCFPNTYNNQKPKGYLFVCPSEDFRVGPVSLRWPVCPAYWSFDRSGATRLSTEDARTFGFPMIHIETTMYGFSWNKAVYDELRLSHHSRGFNPDTQDTARYLGYLLTHVSRQGEEVEIEYKCDLEDAELCQEFCHYL